MSIGLLSKCEPMILQKNATESQWQGGMNQFLRNLEGRVNLGRFGFLDQRFLADDDDAGIGYVEAAAVGFEVVADLGALGKADVAINDGAADAGVAADVHVIVDDGIQDIAVTVDADVVAD